MRKLIFAQDSIFVKNEKNCGITVLSLLVFVWVGSLVSSGFDWSSPLYSIAFVLLLKSIINLN